MTAASAAKKDLMAFRDRYLRELAEMARDQAAGKAKLDDILNMERAIATIVPEPEPQKYGGFKRAIDAMLDYLDEVGAPVDRDVLVDAVVSRGFRYPRLDAGSIVRKSIASYTGGEAGRKRKVIKEVGRLIGRGEWPDAMFGRE